MLGLSPQNFTILHVLISLIGIVAGLVVLAAMLISRPTAGMDSAASRRDDPHQRDVTAIASLYLNVFVLVAQAFQKIGLLKAIAPMRSESRSSSRRA